MNTETRYQLIKNVQSRYCEHKAQHPELSQTRIVLDVAFEFNISSATLYRYLKKRL